jgi:hypothetical protein
MIRTAYWTSRKNSLELVEPSSSLVYKFPPVVIWYNTGQISPKSVCSGLRGQFEESIEFIVQFWFRLITFVKLHKLYICAITKV